MRISTVISLSMGVVALATAILVERFISPELGKQSSVKAGMAAERLLPPALNAASRISAERGPANGVLGSELPLPPERVELLSAARKASDEALRVAEEALSGSGFPNGRIVGDSFSVTRDQLSKARNAIDILARLPRDQRQYSEIKSAVTAMIDTLPLMEPALNAIETALVQADPEMTDYVAIARLTTEMRDIAGQLGSVFTAAFVLKRPLTAEEIGHAERLLGAIQAIDHQVRLARARTGSSHELAAALAEVDREFKGSGLPLVHHVLEIGRSGSEYGMTAAEFAKAYVPRMNAILNLRDVAVESISGRIAEIDSHSRQSLIIGWTLALVVILSIVVSFLLIHWRMTRPLGQISQAMRKLAGGDDQVVLPPIRRDDEIGEVVQALSGLSEVVRARELENSVSALVADILEKLQATDSLEHLMKVFFSLLADSMHIGVATFYRYDHNADVLVAAAGYARQGKADCPQVIELGENLLGECARQRQPLSIDAPAKDYLRIQSGLGNCVPSAVLILPVLSNDQLLGIIEIATLKPIAAEVRQAIDRILPMLAMRMVIVGRTEPRPHQTSTI